MKDMGAIGQQRPQVGVLNPRLDEPEARMTFGRREVPLLEGAGVVVGKRVDADDVRAVGEQLLGERRPDEAGGPGDQRPHVSNWRTRSGSRHGRPPRSMDA